MQHPVSDLTGNELRVGHHDMRTVNSSELSRADADPVDKAFGGADKNPVARTNGAFNQQNKAGNKVIDDILQTESDAHRQGACDKCNDRKLLPPLWTVRRVEKRRARDTR